VLTEVLTEEAQKRMPWPKGKSRRCETCLGQADRQAALAGNQVILHDHENDTYALFTRYEKGWQLGGFWKKPDAGLIAGFTNFPQIAATDIVINLEAPEVVLAKSKTSKTKMKKRAGRFLNRPPVGKRKVVVSRSASADKSRVARPARANRSATKAPVAQPAAAAT
jgi:hypothetical protein